MAKRTLKNKRAVGKIANRRKSRFYWVSPSGTVYEAQSTKKGGKRKAAKKSKKKAARRKGRKGAKRSKR